MCIGDWRRATPELNESTKRDLMVKIGESFVNSAYIKSSNPLTFYSFFSWNWAPSTANTLLEGLF